VSFFYSPNNAECKKYAGKINGMGQTRRLRLGRVERGNFGQCEPVGEGVFELKIDFGPGFRVYFSKVGRRCVLLLCAGDKSSQKSDIQKAKAYFKDYQYRGDAE
jgi:putative addiction module killer protein